MKTKAQWLCPHLCGCAIEMDANFIDEGLENIDGVLVSHRHPIPFTITSMNIISVCLAHQPLLTAPIDEAQFLDYDEEKEAFVQNRGYVRVPLLNPSDAERLYINLYTCSAQLWKPLTCNCELYVCTDRNDAEGNSHLIKKHSYTKRCKHHKNDTDEATAVIEENQSLNKAIGLLVKTITKLDGKQNEVAWQFDKDRNIVISHPLLDQKDKDDMNALPKQGIAKSVRFE